MDGRRARVRGVVATLAVMVVVAAGVRRRRRRRRRSCPRWRSGGTPVAVEPVGSVGDDPFTEAVEVDEVAEFPDAVSATASAVVSPGDRRRGHRRGAPDR